MHKYTVICGDFTDFSGVFGEIHVEAETAAQVDHVAAAKIAYEACLDPEDKDAPQWGEGQAYTLIGIYEGWIDNVGVW